MITNYGELQAAIKAYLYNRADIDLQIPNFISLAEKKIFRQLRCPENEKLVTTTIAEGETIPFVYQPQGFLELKMMLMNDKPLERISDIELKTRLADDAAPGEPSLFGRVIDQYIFWRVPDSNYSVDMYYWTDFSDTPLVNDIDTNLILTVYPDLYLYGALLESMPFFADDKRIPTWSGMLTSTLDLVNTRTIEQEYSGSPVSVSSAYSDPIRGIQSGRRL